MRITADRDRCVGAGQCALTAPDLFDQDDSGLVTVLRPVPDKSTVDSAREAELLCPTQAITLHEH